MSGVAGATACATLGLPFDVAKSRLQTGAGSYSGLSDCMIKTARSEGPLALYKAAPAWVQPSSRIVLASRSFLQATRLDTRSDEDVRYSMPPSCSRRRNWHIHQQAICPMEVLKVRLQVQTPTPTWLSEAGNVLRAQGVPGLFQGLSALMMRDVPFNALFFGFYETICSAMMRFQSLESKADLGTPSVFFAGGLAGCIGWSVVLPVDVAKTRLQAGAAQGSTLMLMLQIVRTEGMSALFTGWSAAVCRAFPANAGLFAGIELMTRLLKDL